MRVASDGFEALRLGETFEPHVVMLDIGMPGLDGFETARRVRAAPWGRDVLLVAITGWGRPDDRAQSQAAGFDLHLVKPVDLDVIESLLTGAPEDVPVRG
ncbi:MAG: response regulator [Betaproteobacteria bacterium]|nr:response regulator [Betaproteobacteria bacterium]